MSLLRKIFGLGPKANLKELVEQGAMIIDVRTAGEFSSGSVPKSINIPLNTLASNLKKLKSKDQVIITCCASGARSGSAKAMLKAKGYQNVHNGGGWFGLANKIDA
jgi:rhodanese-related sulfurtransferase